jgi:hypothetical protein
MRYATRCSRGDAIEEMLVVQMAWTMLGWRG